ncbi:MAG: two-component system, OmpR family, operon response regulator KdpE [Myxococcales bacterium]|nr:two-component system, OmpR family, operon response regulator KdpE [Myxococcales bacterium]
MTDVPSKILVVEDEPQMQKFLRTCLTAEGYRIVETGLGKGALELARTHNPDLVLLDLGLPDIDGMDVARSLREWSAKPIIVISARGQEADKIRALDLGADDYLTKPFGTGELLARMRVALRRSNRAGQDSTDPCVVVGELRLDLEKRQVFAGNTEVHLTPNEYKLFTVLMKNAGKVLTHRHLLEEVWGPAYATQTQYLRVYMAQLRQKLERESARPRYLVTEPGVGYRLKVDL